MSASELLSGTAGSLQDAELAPALRISPQIVVSPPPPPNAPGATPGTTPSATVPAASGDTVPTVFDIPPGKIMFPIRTRPDECWITDNFGACRSGCSRFHAGLDIQGNRNADILAVVTGKLTKKYAATPGATDGAGNGWTLYDEATRISYKFFHMATHAPGLAVGQMVTQGTVLGTVGNTGTSGANSDSNHHLHFEYRPGDVPQDPRPLLVRDANCVFYGG